jgi:hypothetical protein
MLMLLSMGKCGCTRVKNVGGRSWAVGTTEFVLEAQSSGLGFNVCVATSSVKLGVLEFTESRS